MKFTGNIKGQKEVVEALKRKIIEAQSAKFRAVTNVCLYVRDLIVDKYVGAGHPEHPNVITGRLKNSIRIRVLPEAGNVVRGFVGSDAEYAPHVEYGHMQLKAWGHTLKKPNPVRAYPFMRPAMLEAQSGGAQRIFENTMREVTK